MTIDLLNTLVAGNEKMRRRNSVSRNSSASSLPPHSHSPSRSSVRRSLFGRVDHEESMEFLKKELDAISKTQTRRWNFDFANEKPVERGESAGDYEWTAVRPDDAIPKAYALSRLPYLCKNAAVEMRTPAAAGGDVVSEYDDSCPRPGREQSMATAVNRLCRDIGLTRVGVEVEYRLRGDQVTSSPKTSRTKTKLTQSSIDDFMKAKKRPAACQEFCESLKKTSLCNDDGKVDDEVDGGDHSGDGSGGSGRNIASKSTACRFLDEGELRQYSKTRACYHRPSVQESPNKKLRLSPR